MKEEVEFSNKKYWDAELEFYVENGGMCDSTMKIWEYFKHCLRTENRFFFQNLLLPVIESKFQENQFVLEADTVLYRARIDTEGKYLKQCFLAKRYFDFKRMRFQEEENNESLKEAVTNWRNYEIDKIERDADFIEFLERNASGFEGFNKK